MIPAAFEYETPATLDEAVALLQKHGDEAKILTGGHSLIPMMRLRLAQPGVVVDLRKIDGLASISAEDGSLTIGAACTHADVLANADVAAGWPVMIECAEQIGDVQVRNVGTIGGSVVHADPAADWPAVLLALEAEMTLFGSSGERSVAASDFFVGMMESAAKHDEILTAIRVPASPVATGASYLKVKQTASGFALAGVAAVLTMNGSTIERARVAVTGVADTPYRATAVEQALEGHGGEEEPIRSASEHAVDGVDVLGDIHASEDFRAHMARVLVRRALNQAAARALGGGA